MFISVSSHVQLIVELRLLVQVKGPGHLFRPVLFQLGIVIEARVGPGEMAAAVVVLLVLPMVVPVVLAAAEATRLLAENQIETLVMKANP